MSSSELQELIREAQENGFSRRARDIQIEPDRDYVLIPFLFEPTPAAAWICSILHLPRDLQKLHSKAPSAERNTIDVSVRRYRKLSRLSAADKNRAIHFTAYMLRRYEQRKVSGSDAGSEMNE
ncbi:hypothetical protein [Streptomyces sp. B5E4]|uniref:hypothetical protein n=1 Tax=Streptomyces sp. B5E4 TaxID=3153568 RepID=UPI00325E579B